MKKKLIILALLVFVKTIYSQEESLVLVAGYIAAKDSGYTDTQKTLLEALNQRYSLKPTCVFKSMEKFLTAEFSEFKKSEKNPEDLTYFKEMLYNHVSKYLQKNLQLIH